MYTHKVGKYPDTKYFTTNVPVIVGSYSRLRREGGYGDNAEASELFIDKNDVITCVKLDYSGNTCFIKVNDPETTLNICDTYVPQKNDSNIKFECQTCFSFIDTCKCVQKEKLLNEKNNNI